MSEGTKYFHSGDAKSYIERPADESLRLALTYGELCLILSSRQIGKSSLVMHSKQYLEQNQFIVIYFDFQGNISLVSFEDFLFTLIQNIDSTINLEKNMINQWKDLQEMPSLVERFKQCIEKHILSQSEKKLVIVFDEIDLLFSKQYSDEFFLMIRYFYNLRSDQHVFNKLTFILIGVAYKGQFIQNSEASFNIGQELSIKDFDQESILSFKQVLGENSNDVIERIFYWTNGHPFLVQQFAERIYHLSSLERTIENVDHIAQKYINLDINQDATFKRVNDDLLKHIKYRKKCLKIYYKVLKGKKIVYNKESEIHKLLNLSGLVIVGANDHLYKRNRIYEQRFDEEWIKQALPGISYKRIFMFFIICVCFFLFLWHTRQYHMQPLLFPRFPDIKPINLYTEKENYIINFPIQNSNVKKAYFDDKIIFEQANYFNLEQNKSIVLQTKYPIGKSEYLLILVGGLFNTSYSIPVSITFYPDGEIRQYPDYILERNGPVVYQVNNQLKVKDLFNGKVTDTVDNFSENLNTAKNHSYIFVSPYFHNCENIILSEFTHYHYRDFSVRQQNYCKEVLYASSNNIRRYMLNINGRKSELLLNHWFPKENHKNSQNISKQNIAACTCCLLTKSENTCVMGYSNGMIKKWNIDEKSNPDVFQKHTKRITGLAITSDNRLFVSGSADKKLILWNFRKMTINKQLVYNNYEVCDVIISPDDNFLASASNDKNIRLYDLKNKRLKLEFRSPDTNIKKIAISDNGNFLLAGNNSGVRLYDIKKKMLLHHYKLSNFDLTSIGFSDSYHAIFAQSSDGKFCIWDICSNKKISAFSGHQDGVIKAIFNQNGTKIISASWDSTIKYWDTNTGSIVNTFKGHKGYVRTIAIHPEQKILLSGSSDNTIKIWNLDTGKPGRTINEHNDIVYSVNFSRDGSKFISSSQDKTIKIWNYKNLTLEKTIIDDDSSGIFLAELTSDSEYVVSSSANNIKLWYILTNEMLRLYKGHSKKVTCFTLFSENDSQYIVSGSKDGKLFLWNMNMGEPIGRFFGHHSAITSVDVSSNHKYLISASDDKTIKLWDLHTYKLLRKYRGHKASINSVAFSPDNKSILSASLDMTLKLWNIHTNN